MARSQPGSITRLERNEWNAAQKNGGIVNHLIWDRDRQRRWHGDIIGAPRQTNVVYS